MKTDWSYWNILLLLEHLNLHQAAVGQAFPTVKIYSYFRYEGSSSLNATEPHHSSEMDEQIMRLKVITNKLQDAYKGRDVSWIDEGKVLL